MPNNTPYRHFLRYVLPALLLAMLIGTPARVHAQKAKPKFRIMLIFDCSGSMRAKWGTADRMTAAKTILYRLVDSLKKVPDIELALRCYGHQSPVPAHDCKDSKLEVPFGAGNAEKIKEFVKNVKPNGYTPIAYSLSQSGDDFPKGPGKNEIILITDGIEECQGDPCAVSRSLQSRNIILKPFIIGIGLDEEKLKFFDCVGKPYKADNDKDINLVVGSVLAQALNTTTVQVLLMDGKGQPTETDVEMTFYNARNKKIEYNYFHTLNGAKQPDTFSIDPAITYNLQINTVPEILKNNVTLQTGKHNVIKVDAARGTLQLVCRSVRDYLDLPCVIRRAGSQEIINVQNLNTSQLYLAGTYDVEVLCLPRVNFRNVKISPDQTATSLLPDPGRVQMTYGRDVIGSFYYHRGNTLEYVCDFNGNTEIRQDVYTLQPGRYTIVYRPANTTNTTDSRERVFDLPTGGSISLTVN